MGETLAAVVAWFLERRDRPITGAARKVTPIRSGGWHAFTLKAGKRVEALDFRHAYPAAP
jgi:hypothetical protein